MTLKRHAKATEARNDCRAQLSELFAYLDGELSPARCTAIERHLENCACCGELADGLRHAIAVCRASGRERLPNRVRSRAQARVTELLEAAGMIARPRRPNSTRARSGGSHKR
jgi:anti-sigma factor RsiW